VINCSNCGKENQDHYKFCLGCGARLAGPASQPARPLAPLATPAAPRGGTVVAPTNQPASSPTPAATPAAPARGGTVVSPSNQPSSTPAAPVPVVIPASAMQPRGGTVVSPSQPASSSGPSAAAPVRGGTVVAPSQPAASSGPSAAAPVRSGTVVTPSPPAAAPPVSPPQPAVPRGSTVVGASQNNAPPLVTPTSAGIEPSTPRTGGTVVGAGQSRPAEPSAKQALDATNVLRAGAAPPPAAAAPEPTPCSSCGMVNPIGFKFCGSCGNRLGAPTAPVPAAAPVAAATPAPAPAPAPAPIPAPAPRPGLRASLHLLREDGSEGGTLHLEDGPVPFGRDYGPPFDGDFYLNPQHCAFTVMPEGVRVDDLSPTNGVFRKIEGTIELQHGDTFRVGQELLYYEDLPEPEVLADGTERMGSPNPGYWGRVSVLVEIGRPCEAAPIIGTEFQVGRERGDLTFPTDGYVSSSHCRVVADDSGVYLEDRGSSNGTYLRVRSGTVVPYGSLVLIGQQLFHIKPAAV